MAWPAEAGSLGVIKSRPERRRRQKAASGVFSIAAMPRRSVSLIRSVSHCRNRKAPLRSTVVQTVHRSEYYLDLRGKYRVFGPAVYRFYRSMTTPPVGGDGYFATSSTLPHEPTDTFSDGAWYLACSYFNGVLDSGLLPLGERGETYIRLDIAAGVEADLPPTGPQDVRIEAIAGGVIRVTALYCNTGANTPTNWAITYTTDGSTPADDSADITQSITTSTLDVLRYDLPAQSHGTTVKVRVQTLTGSTYSENSEVLTATALVTGPSVALHGEHWPGRTKTDG